MQQYLANTEKMKQQNIAEMAAMMNNQTNKNNFG